MTLLKPRTLLIPLLLCVLLPSCLIIPIPIFPDPPASFNISLEPATLTLQQGESKTFMVYISTNGGFEGAVSVALESTVLTASPLTIPAGSSSGTLTVTAKADATMGPSTANIKGSSGELTDSTDLPVSITQEAFTISGVVANYPTTLGIAGLLATFSIDASNSYTLGQGSIEANGSFTLALNNVPSKYLRAFDLGPHCKNVAVPDTLQFGSYEKIAVQQNNSPMGTLYQTTSLKAYQDYFTVPSPGTPGKIIQYIYLNKDATVKGECAQLDSLNRTASVDFSFKKGWNAVLIDITATSVQQTTTPVTNIPWWID